MPLTIKKKFIEQKKKYWKCAWPWRNKKKYWRDSDDDDDAVGDDDDGSADDNDSNTALNMVMWPIKMTSLMRRFKKMSYKWHT